MASDQSRTTDRYTEGVCGDGAAILLDGVPVPIHTILAALNEVERLRAVLTEIAAYTDVSASNHLARSGSYSVFDEPGSVAVARKALA